LIRIAEGLRDDIALGRAVKYTFRPQGIADQGEAAAAREMGMWCCEPSQTHRVVILTILIAGCGTYAGYLPLISYASSD